MTRPTLEDFEKIEWSVEALGPQLTGTPHLVHVLKNVTNDGSLCVSAGGSILKWCDHADAQSMFVRLITSNPDLTDKALFNIWRNVRKLETIQRIEIDNAASGANDNPSFRGIPRSRLSGPMDVMLENLKKLRGNLGALNRINARFREEWSEAILTGRILCFASAGGGWIYCSVGASVPDVVTWRSKTFGEHRFLFACELPAALLRKKGDGPRTRATLELERKAARDFADRVARAAPRKPWERKQDALEWWQETYPKLSARRFEAVWKEHATDDMKRGRRQRD